MQQNLLDLNKGNFILIKKDNINSHYQVIAKEIGKGAYGVVYKARIRGTEGPWRAIKKIPKSACQDATIRNEIQILTSLDNPNIVRLYQIYEYNQNVYLVTDLCEGGQLFDRLDSYGNPTEKQARVIFRQMLEAVNYLHMLKIAHRDLKPENFLFSKENSNIIKLIDFGLSRRWNKNLNAELKAEGNRNIVGTSYYIAPEMMNHDYDQRCDIWSLGVILYMLLTGTAPFDGADDKQIGESVRSMNYSLNIPEFKGASREVKDLIFRILVPADRRLSIQGIFAHPWMKRDLKNTQLKTQFKKMSEYTKFSKIKKLVANYIAFQMSQTQVGRLANVFRNIDVNHDGFIDVKELKDAFSDQEHADSKQFKQLLDGIDIDQNGKINYTQFLASCLPREILFTPVNLLKMFRLMDKDGNGQIDRQELTEFLKNSQSSLVNGKTIESIFQECDKDKNGTIDFQQFKSAIMM